MSSRINVFDDGEIALEPEVDSSGEDTDRFQLIKLIQQEEITAVKEEGAVLALNDRIVLEMLRISQRLG